MKKINGEYDVNILKILTSRDKNGCTLLHCAAEGGSVDIVKAMIKAVDEVNKHFEMDNTCIIYCVYILFSVITLEPC